MKLSALLSESSQDRVLELRDVVKFFPNTYARVIRAKWGGGELTYRGKPFFSPHDDEPTVYDAIDELEKYVKEQVKVSVSYLAKGNDLGFEELDVDLDISDTTEVYVGYDANHDQLLVGLDIWLDEESFNQAFNEEFEKQTGEEFDNDNPEHEDVFKSIWDQHKDNFVGGLFRMVPRGRGFEFEEERILSGGFYRGIYRQPFFKAYDLIDLRLS